MVERERWERGATGLVPVQLEGARITGKSKGAVLYARYYAGPTVGWVWDGTAADFYRQLRRDTGRSPGHALREPRRAIGLNANTRDAD